MHNIINEWIDRLSQRHEALGGFSLCPYARKAATDKKVFSSGIEKREDYIGHVRTFIGTLPDYEVVAFYFHDKNITDDELVKMSATLRQEMPEVIFIKDHHGKPRSINGVYASNGEYPVILAQPRGKLLDARNKLDRARYYDHWPKDLKNEIWGYI